MKTSILLILCFSLFTPTICAQQISTNSNVSLTDLVSGLLGTDCVEISNISSPHNGTINGLSSFGGFDVSNSNFPFQNGIILSTGDVNSAGNAVIVSPLNEGEPTWGTDADLENTLGISNTLNATTLQFEFTSVTNIVQFNYILASEEYQQEYPCFYSDGFAILIKPANSNESFINIAKIPGTNEDVNTTSIHDTIEGFCPASNEQYFEGYNIGDTNYNGRTTVLSATANIEPNVPYLIKFIIADDTNELFDSAVFIEGNSFNAAVDLGPDINTCANQITLDADVGNNLSEYSWYLNETLIENATESTLSITDSGTYKVIVESPLNNSSCIIEDTVIVDISQEQEAMEISPIEVCDDESNDGIESFDLNDRLDELLNSVPSSNYLVQFFTSLSDAQNNVNPINNIYQNTNPEETIFVRLEDENTGCLAFPSITLFVHPLPESISIPSYTLCQNQLEDGITPLDLDQFNFQFTASNPNISVSYHASLEDATNNASPLSSPYNNSNSNETLYVRLENEITGCTNTSSLDIEFVQSLDIPTSGAFLDLCLDDSESFGSFDLTAVINDLVDDVSNINISYHLSYDDALNASNPILNPQDFTNTNPNFQTIYIRFEDPLTSCPSISTIALHVNLLDNAFPDTYTSELCDDSSNDGIENFDLQSVKQEVTQGFLNLNIELYASLDDLQSQSNPLDDTLPFQVSGGEAVIYAEITSASCSISIEVTLLINEALNLSSQIIEYCDDELNDGITDIILADLDEHVIQGVNPAQAFYFLTIEDAENNENELLDNYPNTSNPQRLYFRVVNSNTGCFDINSIEIHIIDSPEPTLPSPLNICDLDGNGTEAANLNSKISETGITPVNHDFRFYETIEEAETDSNSILNPESFLTGSTTVYLKIENTVSSCYQIVPIEIQINTLIELSEISPFINCEESGIENSEFDLLLMDSEILNGATDKMVRYFINSNDALTGMNAIDTSMSFSNTSNPQTLYFRVESNNDPDCFVMGEFNLEVRPAPGYNPPSDIFTCNNTMNNDSATIDLNETILEISNESADELIISFHSNFNEAENNLNPHPLDFTNSVNPEPIFARIENQTGCYVIEPFELNVVALPLINPAPELVECDVDYDGQVIWDLTQVETEVVSIRQDNIDIAYFKTITDLEQDINPITNPTSYTNESLSEEVLIKVTNNISNCYSVEPIPLRVNLPPQIIPFESYELCEEQSSTVNFSDINALIFPNNNNQVDINYFSNEEDAESNFNALPLNYTYSNTNETIYAKVADTSTGCFIIYPFSLLVNSSPTIPVLPDLEVCDDNFDGSAFVNFYSQTTLVLDGLDPDNFTVTYYQNEEDAENDQNPLPSTYLASNQQDIFIQLQDLNTGCFSISSFSTIIHPKPQLSIPRQTICADIGFVKVSANTGITGESYLWSTGATTSEISIDEPGAYEVVVTTPFGCSSTEIFEVITSESAFIDLIETIDFSDPNNIIISISGSGSYMFSLDDGPLQESGIFENVTLGIHSVTIVDLNGCTSVVRTVIVVDAPKFFTPNGDGTHDLWHIIGVETIPGTQIEIFDRFGKLLTIIDSNNPGWDGRYNGRLMPSGDYWFVADVLKNNESFKVKGHFALRR